MKNVLVLGATGFIGGHIVKKALKAGWRVNANRLAAHRFKEFIQRQVRFESSVDLLQ